MKYATSIVQLLGVNCQVLNRMGWKAAGQDPDQAPSGTGHVMVVSNPGLLPIPNNPNWTLFAYFRA